MNSKIPSNCLPPVRTIILAYIAIGAHQALERHTGDHTPTILDSVGSDGYIAAVCEAAPLVDRVCRWFTENGVTPGNEAYEVAEPFGIQFGLSILASPDAKADAATILRSVMLHAQYDSQHVEEALLRCVQALHGAPNVPSA